jgi:hypothetical protein
VLENVFGHYDTFELYSIQISLKNSIFICNYCWLVVVVGSVEKTKFPIQS